MAVMFAGAIVQMTVRFILTTSVDTSEASWLIMSGSSLFGWLAGNFMQLPFNHSA